MSYILFMLENGRDPHFWSAVIQLFKHAKMLDFRSDHMRPWGSNKKYLTQMHLYCQEWYRKITTEIKCD